MAAGFGATVPNKPDRLDADAIWQLYRTNDIGEWVHIGSFPSLSATAHRIIQIEAVPVEGIFLEMHVSARAARDEDVFGHLEYKGRHSCYVIKRQVH